MLHYLMKKPVRIVQVNPMHIKRVKEINDNSPLKTDEEDPRVSGAAATPVNRENLSLHESRFDNKDRTF
jgi:hypothetical protein